MSDGPHWSNEEDSDLFNFWVEKCRNVESRLNMASLCKEYRESCGTKRSLSSLDCRTKKFYSKIHESSAISTETKVRMLFALKLSIDDSFLKELHKNADIEVNEKGQIIKYKERQLGGLELSAYDNAHDVETVLKRDKDFLKFLAELINTVETPITDVAFIQKYRESRPGTTEPSKYLCRRFGTVKKRILESTEYDMKTRIKMLFVSNTSVADNVLTELRKDANVEVNDKNKMLTYKERKQGGLELSAYTAEDLRIKERNKEMLKFLADLTDSWEQPISDISFIRKYRESTGSTETVRILLNGYRTIRNSIFGCSDFDMNTRIKMIFVSKTRVTENVLNELREEASVKLDYQGTIKRYKANDGSLELGEEDSDDESSGEMSEKKRILPRRRAAERSRKVIDSEEEDDSDEEESIKVEKPSNASPKTGKLLKAAESEVGIEETSDEEEPGEGEKQSNKSSKAVKPLGVIESEEDDSDEEEFDGNVTLNALRQIWSQEEHEDFHDFLVAKCENGKCRFTVSSLCKEYKETRGSDRSMGSIRNRIDYLRSTIPTSTEIDLKTKVKMIFALGAPVSSMFLAELRKDADVQLNSKKRIIKYKERKDGGLELISFSASNTKYTESCIMMLKLLADMTNSSDQPISDSLFVREFEMQTGSREKKSHLSYRYGLVKNTIFGSSEFDINTRIKMMYMSNTKIKDDVLKELRKTADVTLDYRRRIKSYKAKDGSLELGESDGEDEVPDRRITRSRNEVASAPEKDEGSDEEDSDDDFVEDETILDDNLNDTTIDINEVVPDESLQFIPLFRDIEMDPIPLETIESDKEPRENSTDSDENSEDEEDFGEGASEVVEASSFPRGDVESHDMDYDDDNRDWGRQNDASGDSYVSRRHQNDAIVSEVLIETDDVEDISGTIRGNEKRDDEHKSVVKSSSIHQNQLESTSSNSEIVVNEKKKPIDQEVSSNIVIKQTESLKSVGIVDQEANEIVMRIGPVEVNKRKENSQKSAVDMEPNTDDIGDESTEVPKRNAIVSVGNQTNTSLEGSENRGVKRKIGEEEEDDEPAKRAKTGIVEANENGQNTEKPRSDSTFDTAGNEVSTPPINNPIEEISSMKVLEWMASFIRSLKLTILTDLLKEVATAINEFNDQNMLISNIIFLLDGILSLMRSASKSTSSPEGTISLQDFLKKFRYSIYFIHPSGFEAFQKKVNEIDGNNMNIPITKVLCALRQVLEFLRP